MNRKWFFVGFVALPGLLALLSLGVWQVKRLAWKEALLENIISNLEGEPSRLPKSLEKTEHNYKMVEVEGLLGTRSIFILTPVKGSGAGYRVISSLNLKDGKQDKVRLKTFEQQRSVTGYLFWPNETDYFTPDPNFKRNIWFSRDLEKMASFLESQPILVVATENRLDPSIKMQDPTIHIPNNHLQYAFTWFTMAFLWFGMSVYFVYKMLVKKKTE